MTDEPSISESSTSQYAGPPSPPPRRIPSTARLVGADVQVWHQPKAPGSKSPFPEWNVKITTWTGDAALIDSGNGESFLLGFRDTRRTRVKVKNDRAAGRISPEWATDLMEATDLPPGTLMALVATKRLGEIGSKAYDTVEGQYAVLHLDDLGTTPVEIEIHLDRDTDDVFRVNKFVVAQETVQSGRKRRANSPGWIAYVGDARLQARRERIAVTQARRRDAAAAQHSPITEIGRLFNDMFMKRIEGYVSDQVRDQIILENRQTALETHIANIEHALEAWAALVEERLNAQLKIKPA